MTTYNRFSDAETAYKYRPGQDWFRQLRDNQDHFDAQIKALYATKALGSLYDDFTTPAPGSAPHTTYWEIFAGGIVEEHQLQLTAGFGGQNDYMGTAVLATAMRPQIDYEMIYVCEFRVRHQAFGVGHTWFCGLQEASHAISKANINDVTDMIGFIRGSGDTSKWRFRISSGGGGVEDDGIATASAWTIFRITVTCSASPGLQEVAVTYSTDGLNYYPVTGSPFSANIPTMKMRPYFGIANAVGGAPNPNFRMDYLLYGLGSRPLNA